MESNPKLNIRGLRLPPAMPLLSGRRALLASFMQTEGGRPEARNEGIEGDLERVQIAGAL